MRKSGLFSMIRHAVKMVGRTLRSYALLSVTMVLSFSLFLGYLTYTDCQIYNRNKELFSYRRGDILMLLYDGDSERTALLMEALDKMPGTGYYLSQGWSIAHLSTTYQLQTDKVSDPETISSLFVYGLLLPDHAWADGSINPTAVYGGRLDIVWLDGREHSDVVLARDEVLLSELVYRALGMAGEENPVFHLRCRGGQHLDLKVRGYVKDDFDDELLRNGGHIQLYLSTKFVDFARLEDPTCWTTNAPKQDITYMNIYSDRPEEVVHLLETMQYLEGFNYRTVYQQQEEALQQIQGEVKVKAIIACALLLLLGINLYSSFTNAMNDRRYEIGVKRAIGANGWSIIRQFLYESILVMAANIAVSILLIADLAIVLKFVMERIPRSSGGYEEYVLYISPYSAGMFAICAVALTLVFSLIFAYKSSRVEIVQYLKAE